MTFRSQSAMLAIVMALAAPVVAGMNCTGTITTDIDDDVYISDGNWCDLRGNVTITGSVFMSTGGNLRASGAINIKGAQGILGIGAGHVGLNFHPTVEKIVLLNGGGVGLYSVKVGRGGVRVENYNGITMCGLASEGNVDIKNIDDSVTASRLWRFACGGSRFGGDLRVENVSRWFQLRNANILNGDLTVRDVQGPTVLEQTHLRKGTFELNKGEVNLTYVTAGTAVLRGNQGRVNVSLSHFGRLDCENNVQSVTGFGNSMQKASGQCLASGLTAGP